MDVYDPRPVDRLSYVNRRTHLAKRRTLRMSSANDPPLPSGVMRRAPPEEPATRRGQDAPRVLLVDDVPLTRACLAQMLRLRGCMVEVASDGQEGLARWRAARFELLLTDWQMPRLDGVALLLQLIDEDIHRVTRPVLMTGSDPRSEALRPLRARRVTVLSKPLRGADLDGLVASLVGRRS